MLLPNLEIENFFDNIKQIEDIFESGIRLKLIDHNEIPSVPSKRSKPVSSTLIKHIKSEFFTHRIKDYSTTVFFQKHRDTFYFFQNKENFIEINDTNLNKDGSFKYCRSVVLHFNEEVKLFFKKYGKVFLYTNFNSFDLKVGADIRFKILVLNPDEYEQLQNDISKIIKWNCQILKINNVSTYLKYRLSELNT